MFEFMTVCFIREVTGIQPDNCQIVPFELD